MAILLKKYFISFIDKFCINCNDFVTSKASVTFRFDSYINDLVSNGNYFKGDSLPV